MTFKFSKATKSIMENFKDINPGLMFKAGSELKTISVDRTILGIAKVNETFPKQFGIYDLSKFLDLLSVFNDPEIEFNDTYLTITNNEKKYDYRYTAEKNIFFPPDVDIPITDPIEHFTLSEKNLAHLVDVVSISKHPEIAFVGENGKISIQAVDSKNLAGDAYQNIIGKTNQEFDIRFKREKLSYLMKQNYEVTLADSACLFHTPVIKYYLAPES